jgi:hypothetical protein
VLTEQMRANNQLMLRIAEAQANSCSRAGAPGRGAGCIDDATRSHIRNLEIYLARMLEEAAAGADAGDQRDQERDQDPDAHHRLDRRGAAAVTRRAAPGRR